MPFMVRSTGSVLPAEREVEMRRVAWGAKAAAEEKETARRVVEIFMAMCVGRCGQKPEDYYYLV